MLTFLKLVDILNLRKEGASEIEIAHMLSIPIEAVSDCINQYQTVDGLKAKFPSNFKGQRTRSYTTDQLIEAVASSKSMAEVIRKIGLRPAGGNYDLTQRKIKELGLDTTHFKGAGWSKGIKKDEHSHN